MVNRVVAVVALVLIAAFCFLNLSGYSTVSRAPTGGEFPTLNYLSTGAVFNPPDGGLATGPSTELVAVNESFSLYGRTGSQVLGPISYQNFFGTTHDTF